MKKCVLLTAYIILVSAVYSYTHDDIMVWRPTNSDWYMAYTKDASPYLDGATGSSSGWGTTGDLHPVVGDVNGDNVDDIVILRNDGSQWSWYAAHSLVGSSGAGLLGVGGEASSLPDLGWPSVHITNFLSDVNGDGYADAVNVENDTTAEPNQFYWRAAHSTSSGLNSDTITMIWWGNTDTDVPLMGDFDGDGYVDAAVFRNGGWHVSKSNAAGLSTDDTVSGNFGAAGDIVLVGDFNGDGRDDGVAVRPNATDGALHWFAGYSNASGQVAGASGTDWVDLGWWGDLDGTAGSFADTPIIADIDGNGLDDIGVYRNWPGGNSQFIFWLTGYVTGGDVTVSFGWDGDVPLIGQFNTPPRDYVHTPIPTDNGGGPSDLILEWTHGNLTVQNDIYFGTDYQQVADADTSTAGIYRTRNSNTSYDPPEDLAEYTRYYWRIDDVDAGGNVIHTGNVWSFLTAREIDSDSWVAIDGLDREVSNYGRCGPVRNNKFVGIFYFTWHIQDVGPYDITEILAVDPTVPQWDPDSPQYQTDTVSHFHHWGEPELGYYYATDEYVIRKHAQMLVNAGVDVMILDVTNAQTYRDVYFKICGVFHQIRSEGGKTPQICFIAHTYDAETVQQLYDEFYSQGLYKDLWFYWDGKPLIFADLTGHSSEVSNFFTIRYSWAWTNSSPSNSQYKWQWLDDYPQQYGWDNAIDQPTQMIAALASHPTRNIGTSFTSTGGQPAINAYGLTAYTGQGRHFAEQAEWALQVDPDFLFITGWNEWIAQRFLVGVGSSQYFFDGYRYEGETFFVDAYNEEYNRDIEPMKEGHTDNYYYQMVDYIRRFKGVAPAKTVSKPRTIAIDGDFSDWSDVKPEYRDNLFDTTHRNYRGFGSAGPYINTTGRNDFAALKVAYDNDSIYFYAEMRENITSYTDSNWMMLFIDSDQSKSTGWEGYDYVVNYGGVGPLTTTLKQNVGGSWNWTSVNSNLSYVASGNKLELQIPRSDIDEMGTDLKLDFHWADNIQNTDDIIEFAVSGDSAPDRRFNYRYDTSLSSLACQEVFDDGLGNSMDLDADCDLDIDDLALVAMGWLSSYTLADFADLADDWLDDYTPESIENATIILEDGFETGDFSQHPWQRSGHSLWTVVSDDSHQGSFSARSGNISDSQWSTLTVQVAVPTDAYISFYVKISSELNYDYLRFYIDGVEQDNWTGYQIYPWLKADFLVDAGTRTFKWEYKKDNMYSTGSDCAWIDDIRLVEK